MNFKDTSHLSAEDSYALSKVLSAALLAEKRGIARYTDFYDPRLFSLITGELKNKKIDYKAFGGYDDAERLMLCIGEDEYTVFPISAVIIKNNEAKFKGDTLTHRDILGAVLSLGLKREVLGDIFGVDSGFAVIVKSELAQFICDNLLRIGKYSISCSIADVSELKPPERQYVCIKGTVASARLDSIVALMTGRSRTKASDLITAGLVRVNYFPETSLKFTVSDGDVIAVKGYGKANIRLGGESRKGRIFVTAEKYN